MITFKNVNIRFNDIVVMENFCDEFEENKISCIMGPSGCGKTTLLNLIAGIQKENSGEITKPKNISYVFQEEALIPQKTARKNLELVLKSIYREKTELKTIIDKYLKASDLETAADLYPHEMSGGMRQRLALIRAFAYPSDILLMDEPFKALDKALKDSIIETFLKLYKEDNRTVLFVTHDIEEAKKTGNFIKKYSNKPMKLLENIIPHGQPL
ncbi:MAG: ABC transporter ATP-binding protein [Oscillospiraceae bacterium]|jgi:NitT/TauT family transport system ATP-binding protein|nr:ABC transporter ATP-binding protein [Oscillospiraceae bacterium]